MAWPGLEGESGLNFNEFSPFSVVVIDSGPIG